MIVFRAPSRPGQSADERAEGAKASLGRAGFGEFEVTAAEVAGRPGVRLDCVRRDAGRVWAVREFFVIRDDVSFCVGCGTSMPDEDEELFTAIADRFLLLD